MITLLLFIIAGICKALSDSIAHGKIRFSGDWWSWEQGWKAKWKNGDPAQGEVFPLSSTLLVWATDFWHMANMVRTACYVFGAIFYRTIFADAWYLNLILLWGAHNIAFECFYRWVFSKAKV